MRDLSYCSQRPQSGRRPPCGVELLACSAPLPPAPSPLRGGGADSCLSPPLRFGEGAGGRGEKPVLIPSERRRTTVRIILYLSLSLLLTLAPTSPAQAPQTVAEKS